MSGRVVRGWPSATLYLLLILVAGISLTYYIAGVVAMREEFFHAGRYAREPFEFGPDAQTLTHVQEPARAAGLRENDQLLAINGSVFTGGLQTHEAIRQTGPGGTLDLLVRTPGAAARHATVRLAPRQGPNFTVGGYILFLTPILGVPLLGLLVGYWVVAARPRDLNAWLVLLLLAFPETAFGNLDWSFWPSPWYLLLGLWNAVVQIFAYVSLLWFGIYFPERWRMDRRWPSIKWLVLVATLGTFTSSLWTYHAQLFQVSEMPSLIRVDHWADQLTVALSILCILAFLTAMFDKLRSASTPDARRRLRVLAIGSAMSLGPLLIIFGGLPWFGIDAHHGAYFSAVIPVMALFPLTLAYVVIVQRAMDVRILLRMGTKYLLARATLLIVEVGLAAFVILGWIFPMMQRKKHEPLQIVLLAALLAALFALFLRRDSLSKRLQRWLDRKFFREAYDSELVLSELSNQVRQLTDKGALVDTVLRRISEILHVPQLAILLHGGGTFHLQQALGLDWMGPIALRQDSATVQNLLQTNQPATVYRDRPEAWFESAGLEEQDTLRSMNTELLLPLPGRAGLMGVMALGPKRSEEPYTPTDLRTLQSVAAQTGLTLEVAELVQSLASEAALRERMNREIEIAREVQQRLFPQSIPEIAGVSLAGMCRPALEVGGDYYDLVELDGGRLAFAIGDVSGKGISAALIMASLRASLRSLILDDPGDLARMMEKVNRLVYEASSSSRYATFFFATYDPISRAMHYINAGHNPPMLVRGATGEVQYLEASGPVIGLLPSVSYEAQTAILAPGDLLLGYTDGISEAMTSEDEEWGEERMLAAVPLSPAAPAAEILEAVFHAADVFTRGAKQHDDMTLLIMKLIAS